MNRVSGKVAIVTGAARGLGASHAHHLVAEGAKVMLTDVLAEGAAVARELGPAARFMQQDVANRQSWQQVVAAAESAFGPVTVLVNNAGIAPYCDIESHDEALYRRTVDINQIGVFLGMQAVIPAMKRAGGGSIINISSTAGLVGFPHAIAYCASKFAVRGMTKAAAVELAPYNIRVNGIHPGFIQTPMTAAVAAQNAAAMQAVIAATPAGRVGQPDEVSSIVVLLASDESCFSTGVEFVVDGGFTCQ